MSGDDITDDQLCSEYIEYATKNLLFALIAKKKHVPKLCHFRK